MQAEKPPRQALFKADDQAPHSSPPALLGGRCRQCGSVFFPMQDYGCERCGSVALEQWTIAGRGRLVTSAKVHLHNAPDRKAPFTVGSVITDDGAIIRALIDPAVADELRPDDRVVTCLVPETREGLGSHDLRFTKER